MANRAVYLYRQRDNDGIYCSAMAGTRSDFSSHPVFFECGLVEAGGGCGGMAANVRQRESQRLVLSLNHAAEPGHDHLLSWQRRKHHQRWMGWRAIVRPRFRCVAL